MSRTRTRQSARKTRFYAQASGAAALVILLGAAAFVPTVVPPRAQPAGNTQLTPVNNQSDDIDVFTLDPEAIELRMSMLLNAPRPVVVVDPTPINPNNPVLPPTSKTLASRIKFLGTMRVGAKKMALISIDDRRQRVVAVGSLLPLPSEDKDAGAVLKEAHADAISVSSNGATLKINLEQSKDKPAYSSLGDSLASTVARPASFTNAGPNDRFAGNNRAEQISGTPGRGVEDPLQRRRESLQRAVDSGTLTQQKADEMMERAIQNSLKNARQNQIQRNRREN